MSLTNDQIAPNRETVRDFLLFVLLTGLRRREAAALSWNRVDFKDKTFTVIETKNHTDHTLPLTDYLFDLLAVRKSKAINQYVFPNEFGTGMLNDPKKQIKKVVDDSGISFTTHDLRRTFITIAESLDISAYALKRLLNHKMTNDVTAGYIITDVERLRAPMQKITNYIIGCINQKATNNIVTMKVSTKK
jgi:integrase